MCRMRSWKELFNGGLHFATYIYKFIVAGVAYALIDYIIEKKFNKNE